MGQSKDPEKRARQLANLKKSYKGMKCNNPKGRPKDCLNRIIEEMSASGIKRPTKTEIRDALTACAFGTEEQLKLVVSDKKMPMFLRIVSKNILSEDGFTTCERILDRIIGKKLDVTSNDQTVKQEPLIVEVIDRAEQVDKKE